MHPDLSLVKELQQLDHRIGELTREIAYLPKHIAEIESRLESHQKKLQADRAALTANGKERKRLEDDIKVHDEKASRLKDQMHEASTNEQYRAFQHEIDYVQGEIRKLEDRILDRMGEAETLEQNVKSAEAALKQEAAEVEGEKRDAERRTEVDRAELAQAQRRRAEMVASLSPAVLQNYERIRKHRGGLAVSVARDGRCTACNVILRLPIYQKVRSNEEVIECDACGRILCYEPAEEAPKEIDECTPQTADPLR